MSIFKKFNLEPTEYGPFYAGYLRRVKGLSIAEAWEKDETGWNALFGTLSDDILDFAYAKGKWSVSRVILHCLDAERIFAVRALRLLRGELRDLTGYDQDAYAEAAPSGNQSVDDLRFQWEASRNLTRSVFVHAGEEKMQFIGSADGKPVSARALGLIIPGHNLHHLSILNERYGLSH
jgi:hypothetical protein